MSFVYLYSFIGIVGLCFMQLSYCTIRPYEDIVLTSYSIMSKLSLFLVLFIAFIITKNSVKLVKEIEVDNIELNTKKFIRHLVLIIFAFAFMYYILILDDFSRELASLNITHLEFVRNFKIEIVSFDLISLITLFVDAIYFSVITFTTIGYGDISPNSTFSKIIVIMEVVSMVYFIYIAVNLIKREKTMD